MKRIVYTYVLAMLISFSNIANAQKIIEKIYPVTSDDEISLDFKFADEIKITSWDKNEVYIKATVNINDNKDNDKFTLNLKQRSIGIKIESEIEDLDDIHKSRRIIKKEDEGRTIIYDCSVNMDLYFEVIVPKNNKLEIETISGDIDIDGVMARMYINTISGFIDLSLPVNCDADLELSTITGGMYSDFDFNREKNDGYYHYGKNELSKRINNGGTRIFLETISGDIFIRKARQ